MYWARLCAGSPYMLGRLCAPAYVPGHLCWAVYVVSRLHTVGRTYTEPLMC